VSYLKDLAVQNFHYQQEWAILAPPVKAGQPVRGAVNDKLQVQAYHPISDHCQKQRQSLYLRQQLMTRLFSLIFRPDQLLPISNAPPVPAPGLGDTISLRRRSGGSQHNDTPRTDEFTRLNGNRFSTVDERNGQGEISRIEGEESSCGSRFSNTDIQRERYKDCLLLWLAEPTFPGSSIWITTCLTKSLRVAIRRQRCT
jgi:hypothetical protein